jgi:glycosyltransferase involved in cell wall biosynthesis
MPTEDRGRILFLASSAPRFAGDATAPFILNMARDLSELGWQVEVLAPHAPGLKKDEIIDGVAIHRFQYLWPAALQTLCYAGGAAVNLKRNRLNMLAVPLLVFAEFCRALVLILRWRPTLIHSHWVIPQGVVGQMLSSLGPRHVISVHGADVYGFRGRVMRAVKRWALSRCDHVVVNSTSTREEVENLCGPRALSVIPTGTTPFPDLHRDMQRRAAIADPEVSIILFVGRLIEAKGVRYLIEAMPRILAQRQAKLLIVGDGPERPALEELALGLGLGQACDFAGAVPHARIHEYFTLADVFVGPSITIPGEWTEAQGNTFVEALFAGVPVVASRVGGIPDAIIHERTGLLVDERAPEQIASGVLRLLSDPDLAGSFREAGLHHAKAGFSRCESARRLDSIYWSALHQ